MRSHEPLLSPVVRSSFASDDEAMVTDFISRMYADHRSRFAPIRRGAHFSAATYDTAAVGADRLRTSIDYSGITQENLSDFVFFVVRAGRVHLQSSVASTTAARGDASFFPLGVPVDFEMQGFDVTTLRLSASRVAESAQEAAGLEPEQVRFLDITPVSTPMLRYWRSLVALASGALMDPESPLSSPLVADDLARTLATAALRVFPNTTMTQHPVPMPGASIPATIRRAVGYIEAHAHRPLAASEIAAAAGANVRALQYGFRRHLDTTPFGYLGRVRLERAHLDLQRADPTQGDTVATIATRWGFANKGRFAARYKATFGVLPTHTLRR